MKTWIALFLCLTSGMASAHNYKYTDLIIKDYDEMNQQVQARIKKARSVSKAGEESNDDSEAIAELADALKLIFSRPNNDNMVAKLTPEVRRELSAYSAFESTISGLVDDSIASAKDDKGTIVRRSTSLFILENILSEIRPEVAGNAELRKIVQRIADAKIRIPSDVSKERKSSSMYQTENPSDIASKLIKSLPKVEEKSKAK